MKSTFFVLTLMTLLFCQNSVAQLSREVRFEEGHLSFTLPLGYEIKGGGYRQSTIPSGWRPIKLPGITSTIWSVGVLSYRFPVSESEHSLLFVEAFSGHAFTHDDAVEFFRVLKEINRKDATVASMDGNVITLLFLVKDQIGNSKAFSSRIARHEIVFSRDGFVLFSSFFSGGIVGENSAVDSYDAHKWWWNNTNKVLGSVKLLPGFEVEMPAQTGEKSLYAMSKLKRFRSMHPEHSSSTDEEILETTRKIFEANPQSTAPKVEPDVWRKAFLKTYGDAGEQSIAAHETMPPERTHSPSSYASSSESNRVVYYGSRAIPSAVLFTIAAVPFYFGLRRFRAQQTPPLKFFAFALFGYWILASTLGVLGGETIAAIPARIALIVAGAGVIFWGVAMIFGKKAEAAKGSS
ncbi:MAG: hypothetical protein KF749_10375 [Bacteroidetes bacterium]|nr:hypothetical protein [Bacteroidota bacterium]MCW5895829.1 hypothetical protein [Bacteroidota bacterium]